MICIITLEFPSQMHIDDIKVSKSLSKEKGLFWPIKNGFGIGDHPVPILNHAHAIGQISRIGGCEFISCFVTACERSRAWRTIFDSRLVKHARHVTPSRNFKRVTLYARASSHGSRVPRPSFRRNRARYVPSPMQQTVRYVAIRNYARAFENA